jgi:glutamyl-tRNA synthetase
VNGEPLSKRLGALSIEALRDQGFEAMALNSLLARLGSAEPVQPAWRLEELVHGFDFTKYGRGAAAFDIAELEHLNARILHEMPYCAVAARLHLAVGGGVDEQFWLAVRANVASLADAVAWWRVLKRPLEPRLEDPDYLREAAALLPQGPFDGETWGHWTAALKTKTGRKGRALYHPLRLALTGREDGPEMRNLLPLIEPEHARARLRGETA